MPFQRISRIARRLMRAPLFSAVAILTLAIGIGANAAIFSVVNGVLLKPLPFADADRLVGVWHTAPGMNIPLLNKAPGQLLRLSRRGPLFEDVALWDAAAYSITGTGEPERVQALLRHGRTAAAAPRPARRSAAGSRSKTTRQARRIAVMLTHALLAAEVRRRPGRDRPHVDGRRQAASKIIGVLPESFRFLDRNAADRRALPLRSFQGLRRQLQLPGDRAPQAGGHDRAGERRRRADDAASSSASRCHRGSRGRCSKTRRSARGSVHFQRTSSAMSVRCSGSCSAQWASSC